MSERTHPIQAMVDGWSAALQRVRAETQMTLGELITALEALPPGRAVTGFGDPHSYRGYYSDLAFEPTRCVQTVGELLEACRDYLGDGVYAGHDGYHVVLWLESPGAFGPHGGE